MGAAFFVARFGDAIRIVQNFNSTHHCALQLEAVTAGRADLSVMSSKGSTMSLRTQRQLEGRLFGVEPSVRRLRYIPLCTNFHPMFHPYNIQLPSAEYMHA